MLLLKRHKYIPEFSSSLSGHVVLVRGGLNSCGATRRRRRGGGRMTKKKRKYFEDSKVENDHCHKLFSPYSLKVACSLAQSNYLDLDFTWKRLNKPKETPSITGKKSLPPFSFWYNFPV